jgi:transposase-like protein
MNRRIWSCEEKLSIILEMLKGELPVADICHTHRVSLVQAYRWRDAFLEAGKDALKDRRRRNGKDPVLEENRRLKELVGSLTLIVEAQKKLAGLPPQG